VTYPLQEREALDTISNCADNLIIPDVEALSIVSSSIRGNDFIYKGRPYHTKLIGQHQIYNALTAIETVRSSGINVLEEHIKNGIAAATIPARLELINGDPVVFLDGAHNPNGAEAISSFMENYSGKIVAICGMMADKNCDGFLKRVLPYCREVITVTVSENPRTISAEELATLASQYCAIVLSVSNYDEAIALAKTRAGEDPLFVFGSLYLAGALRERLISSYNS
jgi:dihydrofolate synthase/folylpolyglutamate synthase